MQNKVYVGNLSYNATEEDLRSFFNECGAISEVAIPQDRATNRARGFAFVTFDSESNANKAIELNGTDLLGRAVKISIAHQKSRSGGNSHSHYDRSRQY